MILGTILIAITVGYLFLFLLFWCYILYYKK